MPKTAHEIVTAFVINNEPEEVNQSLCDMRKLAEKSKDDLTSKQWNVINCHVDQMDFLLKAISVIRQKILNRLGARMQGKSREEWVKEINRLNRELYPEGKKHL